MKEKEKFNVEGKKNENLSLKEKKKNLNWIKIMKINIKFLINLLLGKYIYILIS